MVAVAAIAGVVLLMGSATSNSVGDVDANSHPASPMLAGSFDEDARTNASSSTPSIAVANPTEAKATYQKLARCTRYRRFALFYEQERQNPASPIYNEKEFEKLSGDVKKQISDNKIFLREAEGDCAKWSKETAQQDANVQIYDAALASALHGDSEASACFIRAAWQQPTSTDPRYKELVNDYRTAIPKLIDSALMRGDWQPIIAAAMSMGTQHGLSASDGLNAEQGYLVARLAQLGAASGTSDAEFGYYAARYAEQLASTKLADLNGKATNLYASKFGRTKIGAQEILDICVNN